MEFKGDNWAGNYTQQLMTGMVVVIFRQARHRLVRHGGFIVFIAWLRVWSGGKRPTRRRVNIVIDIHKDRNQGYNNLPNPKVLRICALPEPCVQKKTLLNPRRCPLSYASPSIAFLAS